MKRISIKPVWTIQTAEGQALPPRLIELLVQTHEQGSLLGACHQLGMSYLLWRHLAAHGTGQRLDAVGPG